MNAFSTCIQGVTMNTMQLQEGIRDLNLTYLMLAQQMVKEDKSTAIFRLGLSQDLVDLIGGSSPAQIIKMASCNGVWFSGCFDENSWRKMGTDYSNSRRRAQIHAASLRSLQIS